jgi:Rhodopirellula transposase DDE domain
LTVQVCHLPPGTSKWNKIEHRMFCHITANWRGHPLVSRQVVVNLIGNTTTEAGLFIKAALDENHYAQGIKVSDDELATFAIERDDFHGEWNYRLRPKK